VVGRDWLAVARRRRETSYHEAAHAVAHLFFRLSGKSTSVTIDPNDLAEHNASKHAVNEAAGLHSYGRTLPSIVGCSVDREQLHHQLVAMLAGHAAGWVYGGESHREAKRDPQAEEEFRQHSDGTDDYSRAFRLLLDADPFDTTDAVRDILKGEQADPSRASQRRHHIRSAVDEPIEQALVVFESLWRETLEFVVEKWPHIQAVADALWRKRRLSGEEVTEIVERIEDRVHRIPPSLAKQIEILRGDDARS
jgi:ATP-dependent Zn protease